MAKDDLLRHFYGGFIRLHALYHAQQGTVSGVEVMEGLHRHGYTIGSGTLYPILHQLEQQGYLSSKHEVVVGRRRKNYRITSKGSQLLEDAKGRLRELISEVLPEDAKKAPKDSALKDSAAKGLVAKGSADDASLNTPKSQSRQRAAGHPASRSKSGTSRLGKRPVKIRKKVR